ncbi:MAG: type IV pilus assembly protein PilM [Actinomycetota bacterium]|nr:type IV pilus assembly protein PilM [Actinomycetota bacterium]
MLPKRGKSEAPEGEQPAPMEEMPAKEKRSFSFSRTAKGPKQPKQPRQKSIRTKGESKPTTHKRLVGLKVGASQLAAARVVNNGSPELVQVARAGLEPGIVVGGELREPEAFADALRNFFRAHKLPKQGVRLGIASNRIGVRTFDIGGIDDPKQLENAIRFRAQETLPIPLEEAVLDYQILGETLNEEGAPVRRVLLVVAYRDLVDRYITACKQAGIKLAGIDLEAFALLRALGERAPDAGNAAIVVASIGSERSTLAVSNGETCEFTRVIEWGGHNLNVAIARALDTAPSEAEPVKRSLSLLEPAEAMEGLDAERAAKVRTAVHQELSTFSRELVSSLQFYQGQPGSLGIGEIVLTGGTSQLPGLDAELGRLVGVQVRIGDPLARVRVGKKLGDPGELGPLAVAIGLGIDS